jgi:hypothetical protein
MVESIGAIHAKRIGIRGTDAQELDQGFNMPRGLIKSSTSARRSTGSTLRISEDEGSMIRSWKAQIFRDEH